MIRALIVYRLFILNVLLPLLFTVWLSLVLFYLIEKKAGKRIKKARDVYFQGSYGGLFVMILVVLVYQLFVTFQNRGLTTSEIDAMIKANLSPGPFWASVLALVFVFLASNAVVGFLGTIWRKSTKKKKY